ncbi:M-phase inducer phosphatase-like [Haliotis cracherodii]|uniref:M-phase inducer phosphatase-like n=1 Tax=Haliotis cracherodii TaxID=6455 RepID=UPI0039EA5509
MCDRELKQTRPSLVKSERISRPFLPLRTLATTNTMNIGKETTVSSPMSTLAMNLSELSTGRGTPKRRLSLSSIDTPTGSTKVTPERMSSTESGCFFDSPSPIDSPTLEMSLNRFGSLLKTNPDIPPEAYTKRKTIAFRRINSLPLPTMRLDSPTDFQDKENSCSPKPSECMLDCDRPAFDPEDTSSQDSGLGFDREKDERFLFAAPVGVPPRKLKIINEDTCSPQKYSPVKSPSKKRSFSQSFQSPEERGEPFGSPVHLKSSPLASTDDDIDDGFLDVFDQEVAEITEPVPNSMASLFCAPVLNKDSHVQDDDTPVSRRTMSRKSLLQRSQSFDVRSRPFSHKRLERPRDEATPVQNKRHRPECMADLPSFCVAPVQEKPQYMKLHRCHSETEAQIKSALNRLNDEPDLIGDCSKPYCLPTIPGKHQDLKGISPETMSRVLNHEFDHIVSDFCIVDCRYPYEYQGGHIQKAKNLYTKDSILEEFINKPAMVSDPNKRQIVIFHCEFSSERGPNLSRFLRNRDREVNKDVYPFLNYPELYLLEGGYKCFYEQHQELCEPQTYKPMLHKDHSHDLRHFRAKSKSWAGEKGHRTGLRTLKF